MSTPAQTLEQELQQRIGAVVFGLEPVVRGICQALVVGGNVLLEGVPGLGKTLLARTLANHLGGRFKRIQCTSDLMPADITGVHIYDAVGKRFEFVPGPLFADMLLVDEVNRTGPKTQSALLEAMEERTVTIERETYELPEGFFVIAAQNPHEFEGTYPLPESQLDRFLLRLILDYPAAAMERQILKAYDSDLSGNHPAPADGIAPLSRNLIAEARTQAADIHVSENLYEYCTQIASATRVHHHLSLGLSTRGALALMRCARVEAALRAAQFMVPDDIKMVAPSVMGHRLMLAPEATLEGLTPNDVVQDILAQVEVPRE